MDSHPLQRNLHEESNPPVDCNEQTIYGIHISSITARLPRWIRPALSHFPPTLATVDTRKYHPRPHTHTHRRPPVYCSTTLSLPSPATVFPRQRVEYLCSSFIRKVAHPCRQRRECCYLLPPSHPLLPGVPVTVCTAAPAASSCLVFHLSPRTYTQSFDGCSLPPP